MARTVSFHPHGSLDGPLLGGWSAEGSIAFSTTPSATELCGTLAFSSSCSKPLSRCPDKHHCISVPVGPNGYGSLHRALVGCAGCPHVWGVAKGDVAQKEGGAQDSRGHEVGGAVPQAPHPRLCPTPGRSLYLPRCPRGPRPRCLSRSAPPLADLMARPVSVARALLTLPLLLFF